MKTAHYEQSLPGLERDFSVNTAGGLRLFPAKGATYNRMIPSPMAAIRV
jgi:hypothetical protein